MEVQRIAHDDQQEICEVVPIGSQSNEIPCIQLNARQWRFVEEYLVDLNATAAYTRAGYKSRGAAARAGAAQLLANTSIRHAIAEGKAMRSARTHISADQVIKELACIGFASLKDILTWDSAGHISLRPIDEIPEDAFRAIANIRPKYNRSGKTAGFHVRMLDKCSALCALLRHLEAQASYEHSQNTQTGLAGLLNRGIEEHFGKKHRRSRQ